MKDSSMNVKAGDIIEEMELNLSTNNNEEDKFTKTRMKFTKEQLKILESEFNVTNYPNLLKINEIVNKLNVSVKRIMVWFQNR